MSTDDLLITRVLTRPQEQLTKQESDDLMEFLFQVRSGGELSGTQRQRLHAIAAKVEGREAETGW